MTDIQGKIDRAIAEAKAHAEEVVRMHELRHHGGRKVFVPPTAEEVLAYATEAKLPLNVTEFMDFYTEKGWMVGKTKMKDWKAAARRAAREWAKDLRVPWLRCEKPKPKPAEKVVPATMEQRQEIRKKVLGQ